MSDLFKDLAIIGLGNTLRRDDGIGIHILTRLQEMIKNKNIAFLNFGTASIGLINYLREYKRVLLLDAIEAGLPPAELRIFKFAEAATHIKDKNISSHELALADLLNICATLGVTAEIYIAGIQVKDISHGLAMTDELETAKERLAGEIGIFIDGW